MLKTYDEIRDHIASEIRDTQISTLLGSFINLTLSEIWNFHPWSFRRRKFTFATVADQEDYSLDEEIDEIAIIRQTDSPQKLLYLPDHVFYALEPNPEESSGIPRYYRLWEEGGVKTNLAADDTVYVKSSSALDGSSFHVRLRGRESTNQLVVTETVTLNGTTAVTSARTYEAGGLLDVSKSAETTGTITVYRTTGDTVLSVIAPEETAPRYKQISLYPIPSSVITIYVEAYVRLHLLNHNTDVPQMDHKWIPVLIEGTLARAWEYKQNEFLATAHQQRFVQALRQMRTQDERMMDYVPVLRPRVIRRSHVIRYADSLAGEEPVYGLTY